MFGHMRINKTFFGFSLGCPLLIYWDTTPTIWSNL